MNKSTLEIYRDCMRLASLIGVQNNNARALRKSVRTQFKQNKDETNPDKIEKFRDDARRALANYFIFEHVKNIDPRFKEKSYAEKDQEYEARMKAKMDAFKKSQQPEENKSS